MSALADPAHPAYGILRPVTDLASVLLAANPSPLTLDGTNTWVLRAPGSPACVVVDPGPDDDDHLRLLVEHGPVEQVLLTHHHPDHAGGGHRFAELTGAPVHAVDPALRVRSGGLVDGQVITGCGVELTVLATPGHTVDSVSFLVRGADGDALLSGDTILGRGTTVIAQPDGDLGDYLSSLRRLADLPPGMPVLPGHGPDLPDAAQVARDYLAHRQQRLDQVRAAVASLGGEPSARQIVEVVYADVDEALWPAAEWSVQAQLTYLRSH